MNNQNQRFSRVSSSGSVGTMIPTPGMAQSANSAVIGTSSVDSSMAAGSTIASTTVNTGSFLPMANVSSCVTNRYQPTFNFMVSSGGNNLVPSMSGQRMTSQMIPNPVVHSNMPNIEPEFTIARHVILNKIYEYLMQRQKAHEKPPKKVVDIVKRLEEGLFKSASTKEEYLNLSTLEIRLHGLIKGLRMNNQNQRFSRVSSSGSVGTMIPTPGMAQIANSAVIGTSSVDSSMAAGSTIASSTVNTGSFLPMANVSSCVTNRYQPTFNFMVSSGGNNLVPSMSGQRMTSQMIPNPVVHSNMPNIEPEFSIARHVILNKIYEYLMQRQQAHEKPPKKVMDIVKRLEEGLFKCASTKEEYLNLSTLEIRLHGLIKGLQMNNQNQRFSRVSSSGSIGTMIPTPGMAQSANSAVIGTSSVDSSMAVGSTIASSNSFW